MESRPGPDVVDVARQTLHDVIRAEARVRLIAPDSVRRESSELGHWLQRLVIHFGPELPEPGWVEVGGLIELAQNAYESFTDAARRDMGGAPRGRPRTLDGPRTIWLRSPAMTDEPKTTIGRRLFGLRLRIWAIGVVVLVGGIAVGLVPWLVSERLKIGLSWNGSNIIAWATLGGILLTAIGTLALAWSTRRLAGSTEQQAKSTSDSVDLQRRELQTIEKQFGLATAQFQAQQHAYEEARQKARPLLETSVRRVNASDFSVEIRWIDGTEPAYDPEVWVKQIHSVYDLPLGTLAAGTSIPDPNSRLARLGGLGINANFAVDASEWRFPETDTDDPLDSNDFWAGIIWRSGDGYRGRYLVRGLLTERPERRRPSFRNSAHSCMLGLIPRPHLMTEHGHSAL